MSNSEAGTTSDAIRESEGVYQVFLNFRGPDTRHGFTDFLYHDLVDAGVRVFRDDEELHVGEVIGENLLHAINNSIIYIPIFSQTYASSKWCLRELAHIVDNVSKSKDKKCILPIFFNVEPDLVKLKDPVYSNDLLEHEKQFPDEVKAWRAALLKVGKIKGWNVKLSQAEIVKSVVEKVLEKLEIKQKSVTKNVVGLDDRVKDLTELLDINHRDMRLIAIYGMGGIGKTTVAKVIFNQLSSHFGKCSSFLEDVRESSSTNEGIVRLQRKLLSDIAGSRSAEQVKDNEQGIRRIREVLRTKKVLVVLDDVAEEQHIENLIGNYSLRLGSCILITTRDKTIPSDEGFNGEIRRYEMLKMDVALALQLFSRHAFGKDIPPYDYRGLSSEIVSSTGGLPLAIEVIGSSLKRRDKAIWEETLIGLKNLPEEKILKKLKISYDGLDKNQKQIFLDIACFFFNKKKIDAIYMWANCQFQPKRGIEVLKERCLIKILDNGKFWMHDQLIDMGRQIVREESQDNLEKQSRLWIAEDALQIIRTEERKDKVQALQVSRVDEGGCIKITNKEFEKLPNLRFLDLNDGTYVGDFARCRSNLRWLSWQFPLEDDFRADNLYLDRLIVCKLQYIAFKDDSKAWDLIKRARNLKFLLFSCCSGITTIPDISKCSGLEILTLEGCSNLKKIESFIGNLQSLIELKIEMCENLTDLPKEIGALGKLKHFSLSRCKKLRELPDSIGNLTSLMELDLSELVEIRAVGLSKSLEHLAVDQCRSLTRISGLSYLKNLVFFSINECSVLTNVEGLDELESLISLKVWCCKSLRRLIDAYCTKIPDDCSITITRCGESIKDSVKDPSPLFPISLYGMSLKRYIEEIRQNTSNKINHTVAIIFVLGVTKYSEGFGFVGGIEREIEKVTPSSVTYEGLIADVKRFGFHLERMWYKAPGEDCVFLIEIKSDKQVNEMVPLASKRGFVHLYFEGGFESERSNAEFSEATAIRRQMRDGRTKHDGSVDGGKMASMENRKKDNDIIGEPANQNDILWSSRQGGDGGEHYQRSCKATTQVEDQRGLSSEGAEFDISGPDEVSNFPFMGEREIDDTSFINDFQSEPGNAKWFEATGSIAEKYLDSGQKQVDLKGEHRDEESAGDVTISTIPSDFPVADRYSEASIVSEVSRWSAEVDELERLLNANL